MSKYWLAFLFLIIGAVAVFECWRNQAAQAESAEISDSVRIEGMVREQILKTVTNPDSVEFLHWGPHAEREGLYRCRYSVRDEQRWQRVYDDWYFAPKDREIAVRVTLPHITHQDREELKKALNSLAAELEEKKTATQQ
jgi:hypothetical protein